MSGKASSSLIRSWPAQSALQIWVALGGPASGKGMIPPEGPPLEEPPALVLPPEVPPAPPVVVPPPLPASPTPLGPEQAVRAPARAATRARSKLRNFIGWTSTLQPLDSRASEELSTCERPRAPAPGKARRARELDRSWTSVLRRRGARKQTHLAMPTASATSPSIRGSPLTKGDSSALIRGSSATKGDSSALIRGSSPTKGDSSALIRGSSAMKGDSSALIRGSSAI